MHNPNVTKTSTKYRVLGIYILHRSHVLPSFLRPSSLSTLSKGDVLSLLSFFSPLNLLAFPLGILLGVGYSQLDPLLTTFQSLGLCNLPQLFPFS